ncbi:hypothetical protein EVAR_9692_1 [Eumeta japonica]|uniref:Uncharacterized protein n=1 Tax=Eumeta variegata TaxID=151549 RepID=A0A4C1YDL5_EUMVA|nr:hypothetical protein EVAR_9692_1 [Eumeta japonica]
MLLSILILCPPALLASVPDLARRADFKCAALVSSINKEMKRKRRFLTLMMHLLEYTHFIQIHEPAKLIFLVSNLLLLLCIPARLTRHEMLEEALLIFLLPGSWFLLMFFAG